MGLYSVKDIWYQTFWMHFLLCVKANSSYQQVLKFYCTVPNLCICDHSSNGCCSRQTLPFSSVPPRLPLLYSNMNLGLFNSGWAGYLFLTDTRTLFGLVSHKWRVTLPVRWQSTDVQERPFCLPSTGHLYGRSPKWFLLKWHHHRFWNSFAQNFRKWCRS